jgi:UDP-2,3-diacylglucosamine pyrophosphatase LpxH
MPRAELPPVVLVVSDLHLGCGIDPRTGRVDPRENFLADHAFADFLDYHLPRPTEPAPLLVLNGDTFDFLRVTTIPRSGEDFDRWRAALAALDYQPARPLEDSLVKKERRYGLRTDDYKTIWKFRLMADGHPALFAGWRRWLERGGRIAFVKGNRDLELYWPLLQKALRTELGRDGIPVDEQRVRFHQEAVRLGNLHIEHGHRLESMTRVDGHPTIYRGEEIRFPFSSFFDKYVINDLERLDPFLDNVRPLSRVLQVAIRRHPFSVIRILYHGANALKPILIRDFFKHSMALLLGLVVLALPPIVVILAAAAFVFEPVRAALSSAIQSDPVRRSVGVVAAAAPWLVGAVLDLFRRRRRFPHGEDGYATGIYESVLACPGKRRSIAVLGHTHRMDVQDLGAAGGRRLLYVNSGTWVPRWNQDRPDLAGPVEYSFLRFTLEQDEYEHQALEWRADRGAPTPALILRPLTA